jgi:ubiquinone/menaquinone biosynthesis C-methylase UbiE
MAAVHADLRLWTGSDTSAANDAALQFAADRLFLQEAFRPPPREFEAEPLTLGWFEQIERQRYARHGYWLSKLLEFSRHGGETLLGLGDGLGTDWLQHRRQGADVIVCNSSQEELGLVKRNFDLRGETGRFLHAPANALPLDAATVDVACIHGLPTEPEAIDELYRVLRPGGKVIVVAAAKYDAAYWDNAFSPWRRWLGGHSESRVPAADVKATTARRLRRIFGRFVEHRVYKRHLRRAYLPPLWRFYPLPIMERLVGQMLILKAFKPLSAALSNTSVALAA